MGKSRSRLDPRALLGVLAVVLVVAASWAASAFAAGGSSSGDQSGSDSPSAAFVQSEDDAPDADDCPEHESDSGESSSA
jgi:hypothetical protein